MKKLLLASTVALIPTVAMAADIGAQTLPAKTAAKTASPGTSGFYFGGNLIGEAVSDSISSTPVSSFNSGGAIGGQAGYQYWVNNIFVGGEVFADYAVQSNVVNGVGHGFGYKSSYMVGEIAKVGIGLAGLLGGAGNGTTSPSQSPVPVTVPAGLAQSLSAPYLAFGAVERPWGVGWAVGAGYEWVLAQNWNIDAMYLYIDYNNAAINSIINEQHESIVKLGLNYKL